MDAESQLLSAIQITPPRSPRPQHQSTTRSMTQQKSPQSPFAFVMPRSPRQVPAVPWKQPTEGKIYEKYRTLCEFLDGGDFGKIDWDNLYLKSNIPDRFHLYQDMPTKSSVVWKSRVFPEDFPSHRRNVLFLAHTLVKLLDEIDKTDPEYFDAPLKDKQSSTFSQENDAWSTVFQEAIRQVATNSRSLSLLLEQIRVHYNDLCGDVEKYLYHEETKPPKIVIKDEGLVETVKELEEQNALLAKENQKLRQQIEEEKNNSQQHLSKMYEAIVIAKEKEASLNEVANVVESLREIIKDQDKRIAALNQTNSMQSVLQHAGEVNGDILSIFLQIESFCDQIQNGALISNTDWNYLMSEMEDQFSIFYLQKPDLRVKGEHYQNLFSDMRKRFQLNIFSTLQGKVREFILKMKHVYDERLTCLLKEQEELVSKLTTTLHNIKAQSFDKYHWIRLLISHKNYLTVPKNDYTDINSAINKACAFFMQNMETVDKCRSVSEVVSLAFKEDVISFLAEIANSSKRNLSADLFRKFITKEIPYDLFMIYSKIRISLAGTREHDAISKHSFLRETFDCIGYNKQDREIERPFSDNFGKFEAFCLGVFSHAVANIERQIGEVDDRNALTITRSFFGNEYNEWEKMCAMASTPEKPKGRELAVILILSKVNYLNALDEFDPNDNNYCMIGREFGLTKKQTKTLRRSLSSRSPIKIHHSPRNVTTPSHK